MKLNALFIGNSYMSRQERIIPALLKPLGYDFTVRTVYAPGQTFQGHLQNNAGIVTDAQRDGIECGRIGGWFPPEQCEKLYEIARNNKGYLDQALAKMKYDVAFILDYTIDAEQLEQLNSFANAQTLIQQVRANNPHMPIILCCAWAFPSRPENLPQVEWFGKVLALENICRLAPVATAFHRSETEQPDLYLYRSRKDPHQNAQSILLIAYTQICAFLGAQAAKLNFSVNRADPKDFEGVDETATSLDEKVDATFMRIARETTQQAASELKQTTLDKLVRPVIQKPDTGITAFHADRKVLVIGNNWFDADGKVWAEYFNSYKSREDIALHIETVTDEAATFESILANNEGRLTPRQQRIIGKIGELQASMGKEKLDADALDGFGDYPVEMALKHIAARKGKLDQVLALPVRWNAVIIQGFRGASDPGEEDFQVCGKALIDKVRDAVGNVPIFLMQHWAKKGADAATQTRINAAYRQLADACHIPVIPVGEAFAAIPGTDLLSSLYTPNAVGIQVISETIRRHVKLT